MDPGRQPQLVQYKYNYAENDPNLYLQSQTETSRRYEQRQVTEQVYLFYILRTCLFYVHFFFEYIYNFDKYRDKLPCIFAYKSIP